MDHYKLKSNLEVFRKNMQSKEKPTLRVVITRAMSYTSRSLAYRILTDEIFGADQQIILSMYDSNDSAVFLQGIAIELKSCAPNILEGKCAHL